MAKCRPKVTRIERMIKIGNGARNDLSFLVELEDDGSPFVPINVKV
jgi:hypothetical protein